MDTVANNEILNYMKERESWDEFKREVKKKKWINRNGKKKTLKLLLGGYEDETYNYAFAWDCTDKGSSYWMNEDDDIREFCDDYEGEVEAARIDK